MPKDKTQANLAFREIYKLLKEKYLIDFSFYDKNGGNWSENMEKGIKDKLRNAVYTCFDYGKNH